MKVVTITAVGEQKRIFRIGKMKSEIRLFNNGVYIDCIRNYTPEQAEILLTDCLRSGWKKA